MKNKIIHASVFALIILSMIIARVTIGSYSEYREGEKFYKKGDFEFAVIHYDRAVHWYTPLNPFVSDSIGKLLSIGSKYETEGKFKDALETYEILRSAIYSTRSFYTPYKDVIDKTDEKIASLRADLIKEDKSYPKEVKKPQREEILANLKIDRAPSVLFSALALIGFFGWVASGIFFIVKILSRDVFPKKLAFYIGILFFVFYILWVVGLARA